MPGRKFKPVKALLVSAGLLVAGLFIYAFIQSNRPIPRSPLPNPNGYDDFVKAARMLVANDQPLSSLSQEQLQAYVATNTEALRLAREGLTKKSQMPVEYTPAYLTNHIGDLAKLKGLVLAFVAEARLALMERRTNDAAIIYLDVVRFSHETVRGGVMVDGMVGMACEVTGLVPLQDLATSLDASQCRQLAQRMEAVDAAANTAGQFLAQEKVWSSHTFGLKEKLGGLLMRGYFKASAQKFEQKMKNAQAKRRQLLLDLAVRAYELERGQRPKHLKELVPEYLRAMPVDPNTGTNLTYAP